MTEFKPIKEGKVREIYDNGDSLIMVATDRISAFDVILKNKVTNKGKVLTQMTFAPFSPALLTETPSLTKFVKTCIMGNSIAFFNFCLLRRSMPCALSSSPIAARPIWPPKTR